VVADLSNPEDGACQLGTYVQNMLDVPHAGGPGLKLRIIMRILGVMPPHVEAWIETLIHYKLPA